MTDNNRPYNEDANESSAWDDPRVTAYVLDELSDSEIKAFESKLIDDPELKLAVEEARLVTNQLQTMFASESGEGLDQARRDEILAISKHSVAENETTKDSVDLSAQIGTNARSRPGLFWGMIATAAGILFAIAVVPKMMDVSESHTISQTTSEMDESEELLIESSEEVLRGKNISGAKGSGGDRDGDDREGRVSDRESPMPQQAMEKSLSPSFVPESGEMVDELSSAMSIAGELSNEKSLSQALTRNARSQSVASEPAPKVDVAEIVAGSVYDRRVASDKKQLSSRDMVKPAPSNRPTSGLSSAATRPNSASKPGRSRGVTLDSPSQPRSERESSFRSPVLKKKAMPQAAPSASPAPIVPPAAAAPIDAFALGTQSLGDASVVESIRQSGQASQPVGVDYMIAGQKVREMSVTKSEGVRRYVENEFGLGTKRKLGRPERLDDGIQAPIADRQRFEPITENDFRRVLDSPRSTFSIDVDTASYSKVRRSLVGNALPRPDAVRIEELVNYFEYSYQAPGDKAKHPFATEVTLAECPWNEDHRLARVSLQGKRLAPKERPPCNLVFLLDTSGSMNRANKLPLVIEGMKMLTKQLTDKDRVAIVVYAGSAGLVLDSTPAGKGKKIRKALSQLSAGGSTNGGAGIQLAYATARDNFINDGVNRVILCTDGDFNVGLSGTDQLVRLVKEESSGGIFLTALGFGMDNHNDAMMERISGEGNGNYAFIDTANEARKVLVHQTESTLVTIAKDVKIQIEFNPRVVSEYRLIGYENRVLATEDFDNDKKDAGEIGAGHQVTALYEWVPTTKTEKSDKKSTTIESGLRYQKATELSEAALSREALTVALRYKQPDEDTSTRLEITAEETVMDFNETDEDFRFASAVASFGMQLRQSKYAGNWTLKSVQDAAAEAIGADEFGLRKELIKMVQTAARLRGED